MLFSHKSILKSVVVCLIALFLFSSCCFATDALYVWSNQSDAVPTTSSTQSTTDTSSTTNPLNLESGSAILIEQTTGQILYEHNIHEQLRPASVTKLMSILLIMEALDNGQLSLTDKISCSETASSMGGSQIWLDPTETLTVDEMLKAICVVSANDYKVQLRHKNF